VSVPKQTDLEKTLPPAKLDEFLLAVNQFNQGRYLECHETFEDVWRLQADPHRKLTQGIIQFAVGLHHLENENRLGAAKLFKRALHHLTPFLEHVTGINVKRLCQQINTILTQTESDAKGTTDKLEKIQIELTDKLFQEP
jgi:predicted metal-dependent hydrolase